MTTTLTYKNMWGYKKNMLKREKNMYKGVKKTNCSFSEEKSID